MNKPIVRIFFINLGFWILYSEKFLNFVIKENMKLRTTKHNKN